MKWITFSLTIATLTGLIANPPASGQADGDAAPIYGIRIPAGYRDWRMISIAQVGGPVNDLRVKLGNNLTIKAYREGTSFPDGAIIARLAYRAVTSEENNKVFRAAAEKQGVPPDQITKLLAGSLVAGSFLQTFSSWSRTRRNMRRPEVGASLNLPTASLMARQYTRRAFHVTSPVKSTTSSSLATHLKPENPATEERDDVT